MVTPSAPLFFPLKGTTALLGLPSAAGPPLQCLEEAATQLAGLSILQDPLGRYISGLQLSWYDAAGARIDGPVLETSPGSAPLVGSRTFTVPLASRMLQVEASFSRNGDGLFLEAIQLTWLTQSGSARSATVCCDYHVTQQLPRETHRHALDPCDIISGCSSYPNGASHFPNLQMQLTRTPFAVQYSTFTQLGGPAICTWMPTTNDRLTIRAPRPPDPRSDSITCTLTAIFQQRLRIFDDMILPPYVAVFAAQPSLFAITVANKDTGDVRSTTLRVTESGLRTEDLVEQTKNDLDYAAIVDGVHDVVLELSSYVISDAIVRGTCTATLFWTDFQGNIFQSQVQTNVTIDRIHTQVGASISETILES